MIRAIKKIIKKASFKSIYILLGASFLTFALSTAFFFTAPKYGLLNGTKRGVDVGRAYGSLDGLEEGTAAGEGYVDDTIAHPGESDEELDKIITGIGTVEVFASSGTYVEKFGIGENYKALLSLDYDAVLTVNLATAEIRHTGSNIVLLIDKPELEFTSSNKADKVAEYKKSGYILQSGSLDAYNNTVDSMPNKVHYKSLKNEALLKDVRSAALIKVTSVINASTVSKPSISIDYKIGGYEDELS